MYSLNAFLRLSDGDTQDFNVKLEDKEIFDVHAVYIDGFSREMLCGDFGAEIDIKVGGLSRWMANFRQCTYWSAPAFGSDFKEVPDETQCLIYKKTDKTYGVIIPLVTKQYKCVLAGGENGLYARLSSFYDLLHSCKCYAFVYAEGKNPFELLSRCAKAGVQLINNGCRIRAERHYSEIFEYLGWCSWDAMEIRVNEEDLLKKCDEFSEKNIPVKWAIIDDMWGDVRDFWDRKYTDRSEMFRLMHSSKLYSFKADPKRFPNGLDGCIKKMNKLGVKVGMWHPITGYWMGVDPDGEIYAKFKDTLVLSNTGSYVCNYKLEDAYLFFNEYHDYLMKCGAEFIKIDYQSMMRVLYEKMAPIGEVCSQMHTAMEASVGQHFGSAMINCMGTANENMWNRTVSPISRCSGDFQPDNREWFTKHIMQCAYNCLIQGQLYWCDWDMWWTDDGQAEKNSILRAISGGPIYVSDQIGRSRRDLLMPLVLEDGHILRCDRPGMPTAECIFENPINSGKIFKIQNVCAGSGVIAAFNLDENNNAVSGSISPADIDGLEGEEFAIYEHFSRELRIQERDEAFELTLKNADDYKLYIVAPIHDGFAVIGRCDKFISPKTVKSVIGRNVKLIEKGQYACVEDGKLVIREDM